MSEKISLDSSDNNILEKFLIRDIFSSFVSANVNNKDHGAEFYIES